MAHNVFIIHGRDNDARREVTKFLKAVGLSDLPFERVAAHSGPAPFIAEIVLKGIDQADAVIALFTPDEQSALYDPQTAEYHGDQPGEARWQARPNVIFEAGVALGVARERTILATIGADVQLFSDVGGVHFVRLEGPGGKKLLFERLQKIVGKMTPRLADWETSRASGDFLGVLRKRWKHYDELYDLERDLANRRLGKQSISLLEIVRRTLWEHSGTDWRRSRPQQFMKAAFAVWEKPNVIDKAYWWLVVLGFFRFSDINQWWDDDDPSWEDSVGFAQFSARGLALIDKIQTLGSGQPNKEPQCLPALRRRKGSRPAEPER